MKIGKLKKINPRDLWQGEATDFTPWLAKEENIAILSEELKIELEVVSEEQSVGPFKADILCKNTTDDTYVLIENQLERTDHTHLGQLMTYSAGLEAVTIIWIAKNFTEEHRAALDWLNRITDEKFQFFGIEIEVFQIGDSDYAPHFQVISKPNDWTKAIQSSNRNTNLTDTKKLYVEYWTAMRKYFEDNNSKITLQKPRPQHWTNIAIGKSGIHMSAEAGVRDEFNRVTLIISKDLNNEKFNYLKNNFYEKSLQEISNDIEWYTSEDTIRSIIYLQKKSNILDQNDWENQFEWLMTYVTKFDKFFRPKIKDL